jgi:hypothetical protein
MHENRRVGRGIVCLLLVTKGSRSRDQTFPLVTRVVGVVPALRETFSAFCRQRGISPVGMEPVRQVVFLGVVVVGLLYAGLVAFVRLSFPFWAQQPVFHVYDWALYVSSPRVLHPGPPRPTPWVREDLVSTQGAASHTLSDLVSFLDQHYFRHPHHPDNRFAPTQRWWQASIQSDAPTSLVSIYRPPSSPSPYGMLTSRLVSCRGRHWPSDVWYVDYLCVHVAHRKQQVAPTLIQTHEAYQRRHFPSYPVSVFKREGELTGIVPLVVYDTPLWAWTSLSLPKSLSLPASWSVRLLDETHTSVWDHVERVTARRWSVFLRPRGTHLQDQLREQVASLAVLEHQGRVQALYLFRRTCTWMTRVRGEVMSCGGAIRLHPKKGSLATFRAGFHEALRLVMAQCPSIGFVAMEPLADQRDLFLSSPPVCTTRMAYFAYNFAHPTVAASSCWIWT